MNQKPYVFISYSSKNKLIVSDLEKILIANGINYWMAPHSIPPASDYAAEIPAAIEKCHAVVLVLTQESQESEWVPKELDKAITNGKPIIPFHIDQSALTAAFDFRLSNVQRIDAYGRVSDAYDELLEQLCALLGIQRVKEEIQEEETPKKETVVKNPTVPYKESAPSGELVCEPIPCRLKEGTVKNTGHLKCYPDRIVFAPVAGKEKEVKTDNVVSCRWSSCMGGKNGKRIFSWILLTIGCTSAFSWLVAVLSFDYWTADISFLGMVIGLLCGIPFFRMNLPRVKLCVKKDNEQTLTDRLQKTHMLIDKVPKEQRKDLVYYLKNHLNCKMPGI